MRRFGPSLFFPFVNVCLHKISGQAASTPISLRHIPIFFSLFSLHNPPISVIYRLYATDVFSFIHHFKYHRKKSTFTLRGKNKKGYKYCRQHFNESALAEECQKPPTAETLHPCTQCLCLSSRSLGGSGHPTVAKGAERSKEQRRAEDQPCLQ